MEELEHHDEHDYQTIQKIYNRINEPNNSKIVKDFLNHCSFHSLLKENQKLKLSILRNLELNINRIFEKITT